MNNIEDLYELSPMQQGMLFHSLYSPESEVYFEQLICTLKGKLNLSTFQETWQKIVARHPVLRSSFYWEEIEKPLQMVNRQVELFWKIYDWQHWDHEQQKSQLEIFLKQDRAKGIALDEAPLMRFTIIQLDSDTYQFIWSHHHILFDGWSMQIILQEVFDLYEAYQGGKSLTLKPCYPYREYIQWLQQQDNSKAQKFWQNKLQGFEATTPIEIDKLPGQKTSQVAYHQIPFKLPLEISQKLESLAKKNHLTLNNIVQGAWGLLLSRYSGESDVIFGATVSGRPSNLPDVDKRVGLFINTLPIRLIISEQMALIPWLKELQSQQLEQEQYAYYSLADIQKNSDILPGKPLFESILVFENYPDYPEEAANKTLRITDLYCFERTNYPITLVVNPDSELSGRIIYDSSRFAPEPIERMIEHFQNLLTSIAENPEQPVVLIPFLTPQEQQQLLKDWNDTQVDYAYDKCIHQLFEEQVQRTPDAVAVVFENEQLTYQELNHRANQLAHYLQSLGVGADVLVGVCLERSLEMIVGLLGILKAGGAYVPFDPQYPIERLKFMLEDTQVKVLLTQEKLVKSLPQNHVHIICLDTDWQTISLANQDNLNTLVSGENLAYVIYTSGSTGKPKGVVVTHQSVNRLVLNTNYIQLTVDDCIAQAANIAFDAATFEIWGALLNGAKLVIINKSVLLSPSEFAFNISSQKISVLFLTTALFNQLASFVPKAFSSLRYLLFGGEAVDPRWVQEVLDKGAPEKLLHVYGPTENTTFSSWYLVENLSTTATTIPIGKPITNTQIYVLDKYLRPVPVGIPGELYIGGLGLARGYLHQPTLTQEKFITNPFSLGEILYKTGDIARRLPDGNLEFVGRINNQIKIRGFRIELEEIETVLVLHSEIKQAVVTLRKNSLGEKYLVAYIIAKNSQLSPKIVRNFLMQKLPDYMIPNDFVFLDAFPLNTNGKINRQDLPNPNPQQRQTWVEFVEPCTEIEQEIATIWLKVLRLNKVGIYNNFFELGGHSLLATQVISRLKETFEMELSFRYFFENPTIAQLAEKIVIQQLEETEIDDIDQMLEEIEQLSEEEVVQQLSLEI
ncbi:non-ribosomal peptide synthetase [Gloeothece verrucosa]|uniref:Amino acid adenylation domain protein n=1 Tax=Gloeothece verrucosa (strain PCC 7822) TaxID=497965 RepID=E0ULJ5_GLOV7|nr:non-ribosomal peptide synthetase [Gloeothece verrucosa]ADN17825.1 amino acid adenylation domain protein [Gloeothece verrucosa PCC 7822]